MGILLIYGFEVMIRDSYSSRTPTAWIRILRGILVGWTGI